MSVNIYVKSLIVLLVLFNFCFSQSEKYDIGKDQALLLLRSDGSAQKKYEILENYSKHYNVSFDNILSSIYDTLVVRTNLNDVVSYFYCKNAIQILGIAGYQKASDIIKKKYIYNKKLPKEKRGLINLAVEAYVDLEPSDLKNVLEYAIIKNGIPVLTRYNLSKKLMKFLEKDTYRNQLQSKSYFDTFTNLVMTEMQSSDILGVVIKLDEMLSNIDSNYKNSHQRLLKLKSIKQNNSDLAGSFSNSNEKDRYNKKIEKLIKNINYLESLSDNNKKSINIKTKNNWK